MPKRMCPKCKRLVSGACPHCKKERDRKRHQERGNRPHYSNREYRRQSAEVRERALLCWLCGGGALPNDPWQADHYHPRDLESPLLPAHRSCNARRGNREAQPHPDWLRLAAMMRDPVLAELQLTAEDWALVFPPENCDTCCELPGEHLQECPASKRPCGHHCNCSWSQDRCHWCGAEMSEGELVSQ